MIRIVFICISLYSMYEKVELFQGHMGREGAEV